MPKARFSERVGAVKPRTELQKTDMTPQLRNRLWNVFYVVFLQDIESRYNTFGESPKDNNFLSATWHRFFGWPLVTIPHHPRDVISVLHKHFATGDWHQVYDFIEFAAEHGPAQFREAVNNVLEADLSGYRFVDSHLIPLTSPAEIQSIEDAIAATKQHALGGAETHLGAALTSFGAEPTPDYRNAIKEAISAVESVASGIVGKKDTLGAALKELEKKGFPLETTLKLAFEKLYGYTSDAQGIRHATLDKPNLDAEDARFMIVACSAFVHFLITKADKAGIPLK